MKYAYVNDTLDLEREKGITMDIAFRSFKLKDRVIHIIDSPGHAEYVPNMISGAK